MEVFCGLAGLALVLLFIAIIGHGMWLILAAIGRALGETPSDRGRLYCAKCGRPWSAGARYCGHCGFTSVDPRHKTQDEELSATLRQLSRLVKEGRIAESVAASIRDAIRLEALKAGAPEPVMIDGLVQPQHPAAGTSTPSSPITPTKVASDEVATGALAAQSPTIPPPLPTAVATAKGAVTPVEPIPTRKDDQSPFRGLAGVLHAFMEEKNIRWGELVSGLLIVGSSVGLVISLWATLKERIPYFPVAIFLTVTAAMHGAGLYTLKRWRLKSTSRGLLLISTLLVPLNVLAIILLNDKTPEYGPIDYSAVSVGLAILAAIVFSAARILNRKNPWPMFVAVTGTTIGLSFIGRLAGFEIGDLRKTLLFMLPVASFLAGSIPQVLRLAAGRRLSLRRTAQSFRFFGVAFFSLAIAAGLLAWKCGDVRGTFSVLSPLVTVIAVALTAAGLVVHQRLTAVSEVGYRTAGTVIALNGGFLTAIALVLAWPRPDLLVEVGLLGGIAFSLLGWFGGLPALHVFATAGLSLACLTGFHWAAGQIASESATSAQLTRLFLQARSALVLAILSLVFDSVAVLLARTKWRSQSIGYLVSALSHEVVSHLIAAIAATHFGLDRNLATLVFAIVALRWLFAAWWIRQEYTVWIAAALLLAALGHGLAVNTAVAEFLLARSLRPLDPWTMALLLHATICLAYVLLARFAAHRPGAATNETQWLRPFHWTAVGTSAIAAVLMFNVSNGYFVAHSGYAFWVAALWSVIAILEGTAALVSAAQVIGTVGVIFAVVGYCRRQDWWSGHFADALFINWELGSLALWSGLWIAARRFGRRIPTIARVIVHRPTSVDRILLGVVVVGIAGTCVAASVPGIFGELAPGEASLSVTATPWNVAVLLPFVIGAIIAAGGVMLRSRTHEEGMTIGVLFIAVALAMLAWAYRFPLLPEFWIPYTEGWSAGAWFVLALVACAVLGAFWERPTAAARAGLAITAAAVPFLVACRFTDQFAVASALRWDSAIVGLIVCSLWLAHEPLTRLWRRLPGIAANSPVPLEENIVRNVLVTTTGLTVLLLTAYHVLVQFGQGLDLGKPASDSLFARIDATTLLSMPVVLLAIACLVYGIVERKALWGLAATFLIQVGTGIVALFQLSDTSRFGPVARHVPFWQIMGLSTGLAAIGWLAIEQLFVAKARTENFERRGVALSIQTQLSFVAVFACVAAVATMVGLFISPAPLLNAVREFGSPLGWLLLIAATAAWCWAHRAEWPRSPIAIVMLSLSAAAALAGASLDKWNSAGNWLSFHTALSGWCTVIVLAAVGATLDRRNHGWLRTSSVPGATEPRPVVVFRSNWLVIADWSMLLIAPIVAYAFKAELLDPLRPWWSAASILVVSLAMAVVAICALDRRRWHASLALAIVGSFLIGLRPWLEPGAQPAWQSVLDLIDIVALGTAIHGYASLAMELIWERRAQRVFDPASTLPATHHVSAVLGTALVAAGVLIGLTREAVWQNVVLSTPLARTAIAALAVLALGSLWEMRARHAFPVLYALGLIAIVAEIGSQPLSSADFVYYLTAAVAGYLLLTGFLWAVRRVLQLAALQLRATPFGIADDRIDHWLPAVNLLIVIPIIAIEFWVVLRFADLNLRIGGSLATAIAAGGLALLASTSARKLLQPVSLLIGAVASVQFGWAFMDPVWMQHAELPRTIRVMTMLAATAFLYGVPLLQFVRKETSWFESIRQVVGIVGAAAIAAMALILVFEWHAFKPGVGAPVTLSECILVAAALTGLAAALISLALLPGRDPFISTEKQRFTYVYTAEAIIGLLLAHLYLTNPQLFRPEWAQYWPFIVMGIAYIGTGLSEFFGRLRITVLAKPLENTAAFLPVLPVVGFWVLSSSLTYSAALVPVGLLYLFLALRRGSFAYAAAAAIVGNATLLSLFHEQGAALFVHPQMFVIPPCITILAAAQVNRDRLDEGTLSAIRYFAITLIYVSSTGEMFQTGIGTTLWLPMVLAGLSVLGILAGITLRVRAFLYLGTAFLLLAIVSMVWHAAQSIGHVWPWWCFLFALGLALMTLFGIFEKKRPEVLALIDHLRQWER